MLMELGLSIGNMYFKVEREDIGPVSGIGTLYCMISSLFSRLRHYHLICVPAQKHFFFSGLSQSEQAGSGTLPNCPSTERERLGTNFANCENFERRRSKTVPMQLLKQNQRVKCKDIIFLAKRALLINVIKRESGIRPFEIWAF